MVTRLGRAIQRLRARHNQDIERGVMGNSAGILRDATGGRYYVRLRRSSGSFAPAVLLPLYPGSIIAPRLNYPVRVGYDETGQRCILGADTEGLAQQGLSPLIANIADPIAQGYLSQEQFAPFVCRRHPNSTLYPLYTQIYPGLMVLNYTAYQFAGDILDMSGSIPGAGEHRYAVIGWDYEGDTLEIGESTAQAIATALDLTDIQEGIDDLSAGVIPLYAFVMTDGDTLLSAAGAVDLRSLWFNIGLSTPVILESGGTEADLSATGPGAVIQGAGGAALSVEAQLALERGGTEADLSATGPGFLQQAANGAAVTILQHNIGAAAAPGINDDDTAGYAPGSLWVDTTNDDLYQCVDATTGAAIWVDIGAGGGGGGEANTASNVGTAGVGVFKQKTGVDLEFKKVNAGSAKITITDDVGDDEVDVDLGAVDIGDLNDAEHNHEAAGVGGQLDAGAVFDAGQVILERGGTEADLSATGPGFLQQAANGAPATLLKHNLGAAAAPTVDDDSGDGYAVGSLWIDTTNDNSYQCLDASVGAAIWWSLRNHGLHNRAQNGSFEFEADLYVSGAPTEWTIVGTPTLEPDVGSPAVGAYGPIALKIVAAGANEGVQQILTRLKADTRYAVFVRYRVGAGDSARITTTGGNSNISLTGLSSTIWAMAAGNFVTNFGGNDITLNLLAEANGDIAYFDDVMVIEGAMVRPYMPAPGDVLSAKVDGAILVADSGEPGGIKWVDEADVVGYILLRDEKAAGTSGGTFTSGDWRTRDLNTEVLDTGDNCSLAANQFTLDAGTYEIYASAQAHNTSNHHARLQNITDATTTLLGTAEATYPSGYVDTRSVIVGRFTITEAKTFEIQHRCRITVASNGFGLGWDMGIVEIYTVVELRKVA